MEDSIDYQQLSPDVLNEWKKESMLERAAQLHDEMRRNDPANAGADDLTFFQRPYAAEQSLAFVKKAPVWFTAYLPSIIADEAPLKALANPDLLRHLEDLYVSAIHTGPVMTAEATLNVLKALKAQRMVGSIPFSLRLTPYLVTKLTTKRL